MHYLNGIVSILLALEFNKPETMMLITDFIPRDVDIDNWPTLSEEFP